MGFTAMKTGRCEASRLTLRPEIFATAVLIVLAMTTSACGSSSTVADSGPAPNFVPCPSASGQIQPGLVGTDAITLRLDATRIKEYDRIAAEGFKAVRLVVEWPLIEVTQGNFDWANTDSQVTEALKRGLHILAVVTYVPDWAAAATVGYFHPHPSDATAYADFARMAAERYKGRISHWEIWNEPNVN